MAADIGKVYPTDVQLLKKEIEVQGELLNQERLDRKVEVDQLRLRIDTMKRLLDQLHPGFTQQYDALLPQERQVYDPELDKKAG
jgi:hypothetical protein